jgi:hypothetical protein
MSVPHTSLILATAQCMTNQDAIDFIDEHITEDDLAEWIEEFSPTEMPAFVVHGAVVEVNDEE